MRKTTKLLAVLALAQAIALSTGAVTASAGSVSGKGASDSFASGDLSANWSVYGESGVAAGALGEGALVGVDIPAGGYVVSNASYGEAGKTLTLEFDVTENTTGAFMMNVGLAGASISLADIGDCLYNFGDGYRVMRGDSGAGKFGRQRQNITTETWHELNEWGAAGFGIYRHKYVYYADGTFRMYYQKLNDEDKEWYMVIENAGDYINENAKFSSNVGHIGFYFLNDAASFKLDNFTITVGEGDDAKVVLEENFDTKDNWTTNTGAIAYGVNGVMKFTLDGAGTTAQAVTKSAVTEMTKENVSKTIEYQTTFVELSDAEFHNVLGLEADEQFVTAPLDIAYAPAETGYTVTATEGTTVLGTAAIAADQFVATIEVKNLGNACRVTVRIDGEVKLSFKTANAAGYAAFYATAAEGGAADIGLDDFKTSYVNYISSDAPDMFADFNEELGDEWVNSRPAEGLGNGAVVKDGALVFEGASDGTYVGPNYRYSNFELSFDVTSLRYDEYLDEDLDILYGASSWIGVTFGAEEAGQPYSAAGSELLYFDHNWNLKGEYGRVVRMSGGTVDTNDIYATFPNMWKPENNTRGGFTIKITAIDGTVNVYVRYKDEPLSALTEPVATYTGVDHYGYISLCCTANAYYTIDNLSVRNLDEHETAETVPAPKAEGVALDKTSVELTEGGTATLVATVTPECDYELVWTTSDDGVAVVVDGKIYALGEGTCTITATVNGELTASAQITVNAAEKPVTPPADSSDTGTSAGTSTDTSTSTSTGTGSGASTGAGCGSVLAGSALGAFSLACMAAVALKRKRG